MRRTIGLLLASGLAFLVAGCATATTGGGAPSGGGGGAAAQGDSGAAGGTTASAGGADMRDFNLKVKCPGVHELKAHGWTDQQIMQQLAVDQQTIPACEQWVQSQPKGYVPPPPAGAPAPKTTVPAGGAGGAAAPPAKQ